MMVVVVYDIASSGSGGGKRLRRVAKKCGDWGSPVQNSVFECRVNAEEYRKLRAELEVLIDPERDSIRFYLLGNRFQNRIEALGIEKVQWDRETFVI